jgi:hypothetical protein
MKESSGIPLFKERLFMKSSVVEFAPDNIKVGL